MAYLEPVLPTFFTCSELSMTAKTSISMLMKMVYVPLGSQSHQVSQLFLENLYIFFEIFRTPNSQKGVKQSGYGTCNMWSVLTGKGRYQLILQCMDQYWPVPTSELNRSVLIAIYCYFISCSD
jgi:hypothetical protein